MLTKSDLSEIQKVVKTSISKIVRQEIEAEGKNLKEDFRSEILHTRVRIQTDVRDLTDRLKNLEIRINNFEKVMEKGFVKLNKRFTDLFDFLDRDQLNTRRRVDRIEEHLKLPPLSSQL